MEVAVDTTEQSVDDAYEIVEPDLANVRESFGAAAMICVGCPMARFCTRPIEQCSGSEQAWPTEYSQEITEDAALLQPTLVYDNQDLSNLYQQKQIDNKNTERINEKSRDTVTVATPKQNIAEIKITKPKEVESRVSMKIDYKKLLFDDTVEFVVAEPLARPRPNIAPVEPVVDSVDPPQPEPMIELSGKPATDSISVAASLPDAQLDAHRSPAITDTIDVVVDTVIEKIAPTPNITMTPKRAVVETASEATSFEMVDDVVCRNSDEDEPSAVDSARDEVMHYFEQCRRDSASELTRGVHRHIPLEEDIAPGQNDIRTGEGYLLERLLTRSKGHSIKVMDNVQKKIATFFSRYPEKEHKKGDLVMSPDVGRGVVTYVVSGVVIEYDIHSRGNKTIVNTIKQGAFFPLVKVVSNIVPDFYFEANSAVVVREAPVSDVVKFLDANPDIVNDALARVLRGSEGLMKRLSHIQGDSVKGAILNELHIHAQRFGVERSGHIDIPMSINELADRVGVARETVSRELRQLKKSGDIEVDAGVIRLALDRI